MPEIAKWLKALGMSEYTERFAENEIDVSVLRHLTDQDLKDIGVLLGHRRKLLAAIAELLGAVPAAPGATSAEPKPHDVAERRQLTVMFCDLVGSTALASRSIPRTCARSSASITAASPTTVTAASTASSPSTSAMGSWCISATRGRTRTMPSGRYGPGLLSLTAWDGSKPPSRCGFVPASAPGWSSSAT